MINQFQSSINLTEMLGLTDWAVFFSSILLTYLFVLWGQSLKKKNMTDKEAFLDYMLMGRKLTLPLFVTTLVSTWYGGIFGVTQIAFEKGIYNYITQGIFWYITYIIFALFLVDKIRNYQAVTLPEMVGKMFGPKSAKISAVFNFFNVLPVAYLISMSLFIKILFGVSQEWAMISGLIFILLYTFLGGFRADVFSDVIQFFYMCIGVFLVVFFSWKNFGGLTFLHSNLPAEHFSITGGNSISSLLVWGFIALATLVDPTFYQRCFAAENSKVAKKGILISTLIWMVFDICTTLGGMYARAVIPGANSQDAYLTFSMQVVPPWVRGIILSGILATILSTVDSFMIIASTSISYDLIKKSWREKMWVNHLSLIVVSIFTFALAQTFDGNIKNTWKTLGSYAAACLLFPILIGHFFPKKIRDNWFVTASILGALSVTLWRYLPREGFWLDVDEIYIGTFVTASTLLLCYLFRSEKHY